MASLDPVTVLRLVAAVALLSYASLLDWRTRRIGNVYWIGLSVLGLVLIPVQLLRDEEPIEYLLVFAPILAILADVYWDSDDASSLAKYAPAMKYAFAVAMVLVLGYLWFDETYFQHLLAVPIMMLFIVLMYTLDIIRGGADAKALLALSVLFPFYPAIGSLPIIQANDELTEILFPFSFIVLVTAAIVVAFFPVFFAAKNLIRREFRFPQGLLGYRMDTDAVHGSHVWLMERIDAGKHVIYARPRADEDLDKEVKLLVGAGFKRIWVTPKVPFIIPILAGLVICTVVGDVLLVFLQR